MTEDQSFDPRNGQVRGALMATPEPEVETVLARADGAAGAIGRTAPRERAVWLRGIAAALEEQQTADRLVALADRETALGVARLRGELARTASQLRFYANVAVEGSWLRVTIDRADESAPGLARVQVPLGPVAVFGASNFPFAFGVLGNDTASALAAGCPVVAKAHPAHPELSAELGSIAQGALRAAGAPEGTFDLVAGFQAGTALVRSRHTAAVAFTGSQRGGLALWRLANDREVVIPVFAEMGTVNPVVVTTAGATRMGEIAKGFVGSFTLGTGQFCTKPGLLIAPAGHGASDEVVAALQSAAPQGWMLTEQIAAERGHGVNELETAGAELVTDVPMSERGWAATASVLRVPLERLTRGSRLLQECFGPVVLVTEYTDAAEVTELLGELQGALAASVMSAGEHDPELEATVVALATLVGRVSVNEWPTGVAWTWAQQHGGPWPATSAPAATSVGAAALDRFTRPVAYQSVPDEALPAPLKADNPWRLPRRLDGTWEPAE